MCTLPLNRFKEQFPKNHRPEISDLQSFWKKEIYDLFVKFAEYILQHYDLRFGVPLYSSAHGWTYRIGKSGVYIITGIQILEDSFAVNKIIVQNTNSYQLLLDYIHNLYPLKEQEFLEKIAEKNRRQAQRNQARIKREQEELRMLKDKLVPEKYNVFHWPAKLDITKLKQLYKLDASGIQDELLADEVGLTLYLRCKLGKEDMERMACAVIRCHNCQADIAGSTDFRQCSCGYQYSFRDYRRSYHKNNMPFGSLAGVFEAFITDWEKAKNYNDKIILIDTLLHEFHQSFISGTTGRPAAKNFMDGTNKKIEQIIKEMAR